MYFLMSLWTFWRHDELFYVMKLFTYIFVCHTFCTYILTTWQTFWNDYELVDVVTYLFTPWRVFDVLVYAMTNFLMSLWTFWRHDECLYVIHFDLLFNVMTKFLTWWSIFGCPNVFLTLGRTFWHHDELFGHHDVFLTSWRICWRHDVFIHRDERLTLWRTVWCHDMSLTSWPFFWASWRTFNIYILRLTNCLTSWHTFWRIDKLFDTITCFDKLVWRLDVLLTFIF